LFQQFEETVSTFGFDDLITWSEKLPLWQRDALRRILTGNLTQADISELAAMAKANRSLPTPGKPSPNPATKIHTRASGGSNEAVAICEISNIKYVNALGTGPLKFSQRGLTVVYGENASGKSGVARILKKAARAREPGGLIRPSVFEPAPGQPASAIIEFAVGETVSSFAWADGGPTHEDLTKINVFDAECATAQVEEDNPLAYTPEILRVFQDLAECCRTVAMALRAEQDELERTRSDFSRISLRPRTAAGKLVADLSPKTQFQVVDAVCNVTDENRNRFAELTRALQDNSSDQANLLQTRLRRLREIDELLQNLEKWFADKVVPEFESQISDAAAAAEAAKAASQAFAHNSTLSGLGTAAWKQLWESARRYSDSIAFSNERFPFTADGAVCVLCQQPIGEESARRMKMFEQFVLDDVQKKADSVLDLVRARTARLEALKLPASGPILRELSLAGEAVGREIKALLVGSKLRRRHLLRMAKGSLTNNSRGLPERPDLVLILETVAKEIARLRSASDTSARRQMEIEREELEDRIKIAPLRDQLKREISRQIYCAVMEVVRSDCDTSGITRKGGEVARAVVTAQLRSAFAQSLAELGFASAPVELKLGLGTVGQHPYRVSLIAAQDVPPSEVLSEGEKTCVALAGFLAELETAGNVSGIILDDPVSSLDHNYRVRVARKLADVSKHRQVVVFTHDLVFLLMLRKYATKAGVVLSEWSLRRGGRQHGQVEDGPPWAAMNVGRRLGVLRKELQSAEALLGKGDRVSYEQKAEWIYERLRQTWERAVEELLLNAVVVRFAEGVETQRLKALTDITDDDVRMVDTEMSYCSGFVHDEAAAVNAGIPEPPAIKSDIARLEDWVTALRPRRK
jgi:hypothetical protein